MNTGCYYYWTLLLLTGVFSGCVSRDAVQADIYQNDGIPAAVCAAYPAVRNYGLYRVVKCSEKPKSLQCQHGERAFEELRPYCSPGAKNYLSMLNSDVEKWLGEISKPK